MNHGEQLPAGTSPRWAVNVIHTCMGVESGEKVLIVVDEPLRYMLDPLLAEALKVGPADLFCYVFPDSTRPIVEFPSRLLTVATRVNVVIVFLASMNMAREFPVFSAARIAMLEGGARLGFGGFIDRGILEHELSADYGRIAERTEVHVTTPLGTDLRLSATGREWMTDTGLLRGSGVYGNMPAGEVFVSPVEDSAEGTLVIDKILPGLVLTEPVRLVFERSLVVNIEGGDGAERLQEIIAEGESRPNGEWSRIIGEFGIGTNPEARLQGSIITDEKVVGTVHVAVGRNDHMGGKNLAPIHVDGVVSQPTVRVDGDLLIDDGRYLLYP